MCYTFTLICISPVNSVSRSDVRGFAQRSTWAGSGSIPFGLFDCDGWIKPVIRLSNALSCIPRQGVDFRLISIRPGHWSRSGACVNMRGFCGPHRSRLSSALNRFHDGCSRICRVCGSSGFSIPGSGALCFKHAPLDIRLEFVADQRKLRRLRRRWISKSGAQPAGELAELGPIRLPVYKLDGSSVVRAMDASPGSRRQLFDALIEEGFIPVEVSYPWVFELNSKITRRREL